MQLAAVGRRAPDGAAAPAERLAERGEHARASSAGSSPAATWSVIACWASSRRCAPPTRRRSRAASSARASARGQLRGIGHDGDVGVEPADDRGEVAGAHERRRRRGRAGAGRRAGRARAPCAPAPASGRRRRRARRPSRGAAARPTSAVGAVGVLARPSASRPPHRERDRSARARRDVDEQRAQRAVRPHTSMHRRCARRRLSVATGQPRPRARRAGARSSPRRERVAEQPALRERAALGGEEVLLDGLLDALGDRRHPERVRRAR